MVPLSTFWGWWVFYLISVGIFAFPSFSVASSSGLEGEGKIVTIPLSIVNVDEATATISVMEEPSSSFTVFLKNCQLGLPDDLVKEDKDFSEDLKKFCKIAEQFTKHYWPPPTQHLEPKGYIITVPLKTQYNDIKALLWSTKSLDDAMTFVSLLQEGKLKAMKVYATIPWGPNPTTPCTECPIKELVFSAESIKEQLQNLRKKKGSPE